MTDAQRLTEGERVITVSTYDFTEAAHEALFDAIADLANEAGDVICATALNPAPAVPDADLAVRVRELAALDIEAAALHVMANADSDEGAQLTAAILQRAADIARHGLGDDR